MLKCLNPDEGGNPFLEAIFDPNRIGFTGIAKRILLFLDYRSFIRLKRSCQLVNQYLKAFPHIEKLQFHRKLATDWASWPEREKHKTKRLEIPGTAAPSHILITDNDRTLYCCAGNSVHQVDLAKQQLAKVYSLPLLNPMQRVKNHTGDVSCFDVHANLLAVGTQDGTLVLFDVTNCQVLSQRQLFGRISGLLWRYDAADNEVYLVTSHFGKDYEIGSLSVRQFKSPVEMPVVFSLFQGQELFPVVSLDMTSRLVAMVEWSGTFDGVHSGTISVYGWRSRDLITNLGKLVDHRVTFTVAKFASEEWLVTGSNDKLVRVWEITNVSVQCLFTLTFHSSPLTALAVTRDRVLSRDSQGSNRIWNLELAMASVGHREIDEEAIIIHSNNTKTFTPSFGVALTERHWVVGHLGSKLVINDVWT